MKKKNKNEEIKDEEVMDTASHNCCNDDNCHCHSENDCTCDDNCSCEDCHCDDNDDMESEEVLVLKNTITNLEEKVRYHQAELINYRKRKDEEVSSMLKFASWDLILEILPIVDNFERAIKLSEKDETNTKFIEGFKMLYANLINILHKYGVEEIKSTGEVFDPNYHEALLIEENKEKDNDIILETLVTGYTYKGRVIRPSSVKVNKIN